MTQTETRAAQRPGRRRPGAREPGAGPERSIRYRHLTNPFEPARVFSDDQVAALHEAALEILETKGMKVLSPAARRRYVEGGARADESTLMVTIERGLVAKCLASAPSSVPIYALAPERNVEVGGRHVVFAPTSGPPNAMDASRGRRAGTLEDFRNFTKLAQSFDVIHILGGAVEPQDIPVHIRHYALTSSQLTLSDKAPLVFSRGPRQVADCFELIRIAHGISPEAFRERAYCYTVINTNSPLQLDIPMAEGIVDFAEAGQACIITPFTLAGAMAPVTIAGALTLAHAEALAGLVLSQITRPGAPVIYGSFTSNVDMKSGSPAFGTPEYVKASFGAGQLARHIRLPWRSSSATASNTPDAQAAYESEMSLWGALLGGCNFMLHAAGWLESGLTASFEKFLLDIEMLQMFAEIFEPVGATPADIALEAVNEVQPGGHFFAAAHTMARYRSAFYPPLVSDWRNFGQWSEDGAKTATQRANELWQATVARFVPPPRDPAVLEAIDSFIARRTAEGGAPPIT
jgi:trimethylamine--corrinoid protein Co-methyltransferase